MAQTSGRSASAALPKSDADYLLRTARDKSGGVAGAEDAIAVVAEQLHGPEAEAAFARGTELLDKNGPIADQFWSIKEWIIASHARDEAAKLLGHPPATPEAPGK